jgi:phosphate transport system permease protein
MTPISGVEGFLIAFFVSYLIIDYFTSRIKRGKTAGAEAVFTSFVMLAITLTVLPIASILITTFQRGYKGLHFGMFTKDMSLNSPTDLTSTRRRPSRHNGNFVIGIDCSSH